VLGEALGKTIRRILQQAQVGVARDVFSFGIERILWWLKK
jgi:hypothetical protein